MPDDDQYDWLRQAIIDRMAEAAGETPEARQRCGASRSRLQPWQKGGVDGPPLSAAEASHMDAIIYLVGLVVIVMAILSFFGLR